MEINKLFLYQLTYTRNISMKNTDAFYKAQIQIKHCSFHNKQKINCEDNNLKCLYLQQFNLRFISHPDTHLSLSHLLNLCTVEL